MGTIRKVFASSSNKRYFIGYSSGLLELRTSTNFEIETTFQDLGDIIDITSDDKTFVVISNTSGELIYIAFSDQTKTILQTKSESPIVSILLSPDYCTLAGW